LHAVGELLSLGEQLLEVAEAAGKGFAPRVDQLGPRQHQVNESQVPEVVRHLVDEEGLAGAVDARFLEVTLPERAYVLRSQLREHLRVAILGGIDLAPPKL